MSSRGLKDTEHPCPAGFFCPQNSTAPIACPGGHYCPAVISVPQICALGSYSTGQNETCKTCPESYYCPDINGTVTPFYCDHQGSECPAGSSSQTPCTNAMRAGKASCRWLLCFNIGESSGTERHCADGVQCAEVGGTRALTLRRDFH